MHKSAFDEFSKHLGLTPLSVEDAVIPDGASCDVPQITDDWTLDVLTSAGLVPINPAPPQKASQTSR